MYDVINVEVLKPNQEGFHGMIYGSNTGSLLFILWLGWNHRATFGHCQIF